MGLSYVSCAYYKLSSVTSAVQLVPLGTRGRLFSIWWNPVGTTGTSGDFTSMTIKDGDSSGTVIWTSGNTEYSTNSVGGSGVYPYKIPQHGILFENGLNAIRPSYGGMHSITVTYSGGPPEING